MRPALKTALVAASLILDPPLAASASDGASSLKASFVETGPNGVRSSGTSLAVEGKGVRVAGWAGGSGEFETSPGYDIELVPALRGETLDVAVNGRLHDAYMDGPIPS